MSHSGSSKTRQRRRRRGTATRRMSAELRQSQRRRRAGIAEVLACGAVAIISIALVALIWITAERTIREQTEDARARVEAAVTAQAATLTAQVQNELAMIDQSLAVLQSAWDSNPDGFNLATWRRNMPGLTAVANDVFIANDKHVIVQDINPAAVGQGIGSAYATFSDGSLEPIQSSGPHGHDNALAIGELGSGGVTRQFLMYMVRPLAKPTGWLLGASYRSSALTSVFASAGLGQGGLAALVDTRHGGVQALAGTAAVRPRLSVADTPMFTEMMGRPDGGIWVGRTPIDGVDRIIAFHRIPDRELMVLVGAVTGTAMAPAEIWAAAVQTLAALASVLVLAIGVTLLWELWHWRSTRRRRRALTQAETMLVTMRADLATARAQSASVAGQVQAILAGVTEGVAITDAQHHLTGWNPRFATLSGLAPAALHEGLPLDDLLRQQALAGRFGASDTVDADVARVAAALRPSSGFGEVAATDADGAGLLLRSQAVPDGGLLLILLAAALATPAVAAEPTQADPVAP